MESYEKKVFKEKCDKNEEFVRDDEKVERRTRPRHNKTRLLRTATSQCLLSSDNQKELVVKSKQDSTISSSTSGLLFTRPLSSSSKEQQKTLSFHRPERSRANSFSGTGNAIREELKAKSQPRRPSLSRKTSIPTLNRRSSYFSFQSIQRSLLAEGGSKWLLSNDSRGLDRKRSRTGSMQIIISSDEGENEEKRKLAFFRFRRAVSLVRTFTALYLSIKKYADQDKTRQYDLYYMRDMLPDNKDRPTLMKELPFTFNKHLYSRENTLHFPLWARIICTKMPEYRSEAEMNNLVALLRGIKSFNKFSREAQRYLCQTMTYACYERRRIIVRQGHPGFSFFFIVSGSVSVTITRKDEKSGIYITNTVDLLEKNEAFGEIALISEEAKRTATIICRERVEVLVVNRETILNYCPDVFQREHDEKIRVMKSHSLFAGWGEDLLRSLTHRSHIREFSYGKLVDIDSTVSESIYFIIKGKIEMLRRIDLRAVAESADKVNRPRGKLLRKTSGKKASFVNVGSLQANDSWDLKTLSDKIPSRQPGNILVSAGVRVLKVPKRRVVELMPKGYIEEFQKNFFSRHRYLTEEEVYSDYVVAETWLEYRKNVLRSVIDVKEGRLVANVSAAAKNSSGRLNKGAPRDLTKPS